MWGEFYPAISKHNLFYRVSSDTYNKLISFSGDFN